MKDNVVSKPFRIPELIPKIEELVIRTPTPTVPPLPLNTIVPVFNEPNYAPKPGQVATPPSLLVKAASSPSIMKSILEKNDIDTDMT